MRASVLPGARLARRAGRFVWLSIDTENGRNAAFLERFPVDVWPTFLVIDPREETPVLRWPGSATAAQLDALLQDGARQVAAGAAAGVGRAASLLAAADRAHAAGRLDEARAAYRRALDEAGPRWERRPRAVASLVLVEQAQRRQEACAGTAAAEGARLPRGPEFALVAATGLACATEEAPETAGRAEALGTLEALAREALAVPHLLADDRSGVYEALVEARTAQGDPAGARRLAERWWTLLERERRRARSAEARAALDGARVDAALALGDPGRALPALRESERALPRDYNPPARLALLLRALGRLPEARAAAVRALARGYGPRKLRVYRLLASIEASQGERAAARATLDEAEIFAASLPGPQQRPEALAALRRERAALGSD